MNPQRPTALCLAAACGLLVALGLTRAVHAAPPVVVSEGDVHVFQLSFDGSRLMLAMQRDPPLQGGSLNPADTWLSVSRAAMVTLPDAAPMSFLGNPGERIWILPQTPTPGLLRPGISTAQLTAHADLSQLELRLAAVVGPPSGKFFLYDAAAPDAKVLWRSDILPASHFGVPLQQAPAYQTWAFTQPGVYVLQVEACALRTALAGGASRLCWGLIMYAVMVEADAEVSPTPSVTPSSTPTTVATRSAATGTPTPTPSSTATSRPSPSGTPTGTPTPTPTVHPTAPAEPDPTGTPTPIPAATSSSTPTRSPVPTAVPPTPTPIPSNTPPPSPTTSQSATLFAPAEAGGVALTIANKDIRLHFEGLRGGQRVLRGQLPEVTVVSLGDADWHVNVSSTDFANVSNSSLTLGPNRLGWQPSVVTASMVSPGRVEAGPPVTPGPNSGDGLAGSGKLLARSHNGGLGVAVLAGDLTVEVPVSTPLGNYVSTLTITAFND